MMNDATEPTGTLEVALSHTRRLLDDTDAAMAAEQAGEILKAVPNHPMAMLLLGVARRKTGNARTALHDAGLVERYRPE